MAPIKSTVGRSVGKLLGVFRDRDLSLNSSVITDRIPFVAATGGTKTIVGSYTYHTFYVSVASPYPTTTDLTSSFKANQSLTVDYLLIGGGGAGGGTNPGQVGAGGGGAGAVIYKTGVSLSIGTYPVTVGRGGESTANTVNGSSVNKGGSTIFNSLTAEGGGYGGRSNNGANGAGQVGSPGGSGGGGGAEWSPPATNQPGGTASGSNSYPGGTDTVTPPVGWGRNGGSGAYDPQNLSGGGAGGGAGGAGGNGVSVGDGGDGGNGATYTVLLNNGTTSANSVAGGGGGGSYAGYSGTGGTGGGGYNPDANTNWPTPSLIYPATQPTKEGQDGYGGGGGGGSFYDITASPKPMPSQRGGCGFLQIRYLTP